MTPLLMGAMVGELELVRELKAAVKAFGRDVTGLRAENRALKESSGELEKRLRELNAEARAL